MAETRPLWPAPMITTSARAGISVVMTPEPTASRRTKAAQPVARPVVGPVVRPVVGGRSARGEARGEAADEGGQLRLEERFDVGHRPAQVPEYLQRDQAVQPGPGADEGGHGSGGEGGAGG